MDPFKIGDIVITLSGFTSGTIEAIVEGHIDVRVRSGALMRNCIPSNWRLLSSGSVKPKVQAVPLIRGDECYIALKDADGDEMILNGTVKLTREESVLVETELGFETWVSRRVAKRGTYNG